MDECHDARHVRRLNSLESDQLLSQCHTTMLQLLVVIHCQRIIHRLFELM